MCNKTQDFRQRMLNVSVYDDEGITYKLPDHVHSEASSSW